MTTHEFDGQGLAGVVARIEDERQIRNLIARLAHLADYGDLTEYLNLFTEDAEWRYLDGVQRGVAAIEADRVARRSRGTQGPRSRTRHIVTTTWVEADGPDTATAHSYFEFVTGIPDAAVAGADEMPVVHRVGRYEDTFQRTSSGWRLRIRRTTLAD